MTRQILRSQHFTTIQSPRVLFENRHSPYSFSTPHRTEHVNKLKQYSLLAVAIIFLMLWAVGSMLPVGGAYATILLVAAAVIAIYTLPGIYRRFNIKHHV